MTPLLTDDEMPALPEPEGACAACGFGDGIYQASHMRAHARAVEARVREKMGEVPTALVEAVDTLLECAPCECPHRMREKQGEHFSHCYLFDLNVARSGAGEKR